MGLGSLIMILIIIILVFTGSKKLNKEDPSYIGALTHFAVAGGLSYLVWTQLKHKQNMDSEKQETKRQRALALATARARRRGAEDELTVPA